jgi:hypothetical protein
MRHPVIDLLEVAEAENKTGEVTVALFAGVATFTLTHADANIGSEIMHTIIRGFNRITRLLLKKGAARSGRGSFPRSTAHRTGYCVLVFRVWVQRKESNGGDDPVLQDFLT